MSQQSVQEELHVDQYTLGLVGPDQEWAGTVADGGRVTMYTRPGCWGPMITPSFRGGTRSHGRSGSRGLASATLWRSTSATSR